jgi:hypothetical protein
VITVKQVKKAAGRNRPALYLVFRGADVIGMLEKYRDTRSERHPWKAFWGTGEKVSYLGAFYPEDGGRAAALARITG